jgi:broad specificity phosphatase PhoE
VARWLLVRHGESVANAEGWLAGHLDVALSARGESQARLLRPILADAGFTHVFASDLQRAWRTAVLAGCEDVVHVPGLRERHLGAWEGRRRSDLVASGEMPTLLTWSHGPPGGESQRDLARRVLDALAGMEAASGAVNVVVAHGGVLRVLEGLHRGRSRATLGTTPVDNATVLDWEIPTGRWAALAADLDDDGSSPDPAAAW